ncbi:MAG: methyltransferase domain-containing protein [Polyangiaceae bacterium]|nr:methyltransferase domain-containing protein [Polyangiaceae bacterium]
MTTPKNNPPKYVDGHLAELSERVHLSGQTDLFMHLGHWHSLDGAVSLADLRQAQKRTNDHLIQLADIEDGQVILDVGCGFGGTIAALDVYASQLQLVGLNIDPRQLDVARSNVVSRRRNSIEWVHADACELPFPDNVFERVFAIECIFHFASRKRFLAEAARVLLPMGKLIVTDLVASDTLSQLRRELPTGLEKALEHALSPCPHFWTGEGSYSEMAAAAGLSIVTKQDATLATLPTYACILRGKTVDFASENEPINDRGVAALAWLQMRGLIRVEYNLFQKIKA